MNEKTSPLIAHLEELRHRIISCFLAIGVASALSYCYKDKILIFLIKPVGRVFFFTLTEAFVTYLKISLASGIILTSPYIAYHLWAFTWSAFKPIEKRYITTYGILSLILFALGMIFGYFIGLPAAICFLLSFTKYYYLMPIISVSKYVNFCLMAIVISGLSFELPLIITFITDTGLVTIEQITSRRKYIILGIFIMAAFLTPPDVVTQLLAAIPMCLLFEASIIISKFNKLSKVKHKA